MFAVKDSIVFEYGKSIFTVKVEEGRGFWLTIDGKDTAPFPTEFEDWPDMERFILDFAPGNLPKETIEKLSGFFVRNDIMYGTEN